MKELLIYLISISSFTLTQCEPWLNWYVELYSNWDNKVFICENVKRPREEIILHELWHILYYRKLTDKQKQIIRERYKTSLSSSWTLMKRWFPSMYAIVDEEEYFSEMFTYYIIKKLWDWVIESKVSVLID